MPTRRIPRALRRPGTATTQVVAEPASFVDFLNTIRQNDLPILPVSSQHGHEIIGRGLSGSIQQAAVDRQTSLAFKQGVPSKCERDNHQCQDWYSLVTEIAVLNHPPLRENPHIIDVLGVTFSIEPTGDNIPSHKAWPLLIMKKAGIGDIEFLLTHVEQIKFQIPLLAGVVEAVYLLHACGRYLHH